MLVLVGSFLSCLVFTNSAGATPTTQPSTGPGPIIATTQATAADKIPPELLAKGSRAVEPLVKMFEGDNGQSAHEALANMIELPWSRAERQAIGERLAEQLDPGKKHSAAVRRQVCELLSRFRDRVCIDALYKTLMDVDVREAARQALIRIESPNATQALIAGLQIVPADFRPQLIDALGEKGDQRALPILLAVARDAPADMRVAALQALGHIPDPSVRPFLRNMVASKEIAIRAAAIAGLSTIRDANDLDLFLEQAKQGPAEITSAALPGLLAIAREREADDRAGAAVLYTQVFNWAHEEKNVLPALDGIARTASVEETDLLPSILPMLLDEQVPVEVCRAAARLAELLPTERGAEAVAILQNVAVICSSDPVGRRAVEAVRARDIAFDPAHALGFVTCWWVAGPLPAEEKSWESCSWAGGPTDVSKKLRVGDTARAWIKQHSPDPRGFVTVESNDNQKQPIQVFAWAEISSPATRDGLLKISSDGTLAVWFNGQRVYAHQGAQALTPDEDEVSVKLRSGRNTVLVKTQSPSAARTFSLRIAGVGSERISLTQRME